MGQRIKTSGICRHCGKPRATKPRGLCYTCYYRPGVRERYPVKNVGCGKRERPDYYGPSPVPMATGELPFTEGKLAVLQARASAGESLFSGADARRELA